MILEIVKVASLSLASNKTRSLLTMLGVIIGVAAVIVMMSISAGTEATISEAINGLGSNLIFINPSMSRSSTNQRQTTNSTGLVYKDVEAIREKISGVAGVSVEQRTSVTAKYSSTTVESVTMIGTTPDYVTVRDVSVTSGRWFTDDELTKAQKVVVLGQTIAKNLFGDVDPVGQSFQATNEKVTVIGVLAPKGLVSGTDFDQQIYCPINLIFKKFMPSQFAKMMGDRVSTIYVSVEDKDQMQNVIQQITLLLLTRHNLTTDTADFSIRTQDDIIQTQESTTSSFRTLLSWVAGVSLIVGGIGIMNIMLVSVTERTREIGLRQAVGATPQDIQIQFLSEALMLSLLGGIIGVLAGVGGSLLFGQFSGMRTVIVPYSIVLSFCSSAVVGIFFGFLPAQKAAELDPIDALRHE